ncbi:Phage tail protein E [Serratia ficaria]|uniref:phage tail assembly protein n=1 Tax=Serratia ficaria TaxID=61651 RepID=UPI0021826D0E|nr:phage tail assembly protein [Serratia ficaria]CAI2487714.1 Phage tail protein E [Serratia ficaria]CAI2530762.1 Phage tail protein E [Serratia ficaria]
MSVTLTNPIKRNGNEIATVTITDTIKQAGSLRGLRLVDVLNFDYDAISTLLTRVTAPALTSAEISTLDTGDFVSFIEELTPFLTKAAPSVPNAAETGSK